LCSTPGYTTSAEDSKLEAAFEELETGKTPDIEPEDEKVVADVEDCAKTLEDEIKQLIKEDAEDKQEAKEKDAIEEEEEPDDFETLEVLQQKLQEQARANYLLLAKVRKYDGYIKQLIEMVDRLGARQEHFRLDHYF
jgi:hypothetical protein